ncbi:MAG: 5'-nucleotidase C-terminal domain-containing protein [Bacteroidetes bacterium]|nr:5'-nucleotidase C-terminal domain-containing protein [Bacteroidota bacterium]
MRAFREISFAVVILLFLVSCERHFVVSKHSAERISVNASLPSDQEIINIIQPYKDSIDELMSVVIGNSAISMSKGRPESLLGNLLGDLVLDKSKALTDNKVDFAILNYGGIRISTLPAGEITVGKIYELMPFENKVLVLTLDGVTTLDLLHRIAKSGGWPMSGATFIIQNEKATSIKIAGELFDINKDYLVAMPDYIANGGDKMTMLKDKPRKDLGILIRSMIIEYITELAEEGISLSSKLDNRIIESYE